MRTLSKLLLTIALIMTMSDAARAGDPKSYTISGYTREWQGSYATPDKDRHRVNVTRVEVSDDARSVRLHVDRVREEFVYEVTCGAIGADAKTPLWPTTGHYTMKRIPAP